MASLTEPMAVYVTRKDGDGLIWRYTVSAWMAIAVMLLATFNAIVWGVLGLVLAVMTVVGWF